MLISESSIAPRSEFHDLISNQGLDRLKQLFLEEFRIKTHPCENRFEIIEHLLHLIKITLTLKVRWPDSPSRSSGEVRLAALEQ
jgi:hypothetical protein